MRYGFKRGFSAESEKNYAKSNEEVRIRGAKSLPKKLKAAILNSVRDTAVYRQELAQAFVDGVCEKIGIPSVRVYVYDKARPHSTNGRGSLRSQTLGQYRFVSCTRTPVSITIWNLTAVRKDRVSAKMFLGTLEHELIHHYDICKLKLSNSPHTSGFYQRIGILDSLFGMAA